VRTVTKTIVAKFRQAGLVVALGALALIAACAGEGEVGSNAWSIVVLPDTQDYTESFEDPFESQIDWILDNIDALDIRFVLHEGDIVEFNEVEQWRVAQRQLGRLSGRVPLALSIGNHDMGIEEWADVRSSKIDDYFAWEELADKSNRGGRYDDTIWNSYYYFAGDVTEWLILSLEFGPRSNVLQWADDVIANHPEHDVIVLTHAYLYSDGTRYDWGRKGESQRWNPHSYDLQPPEAASESRSVNDGEQMWNQLVSRHPNIRFVLSGHTLNDGVGRLTSTGDAGNEVHQLMANYQHQVVHNGQSRADSGFLRVMEFNEEGGAVQVRTYSPWLDQSLDDPDNLFTLSLK
jgi:hypothetical protein